MFTILMAMDGSPRLIIPPLVPLVPFGPFEHSMDAEFGGDDEEGSGRGSVVGGDEPVDDVKPILCTDEEDDGDDVSAK